MEHPRFSRFLLSLHLLVYDGISYTCPYILPTNSTPPATTGNVTNGERNVDDGSKGCTIHCDKFKKFSKKKIPLDCDIFPLAEQQECRQDCALCPQEICDPNGPRIVYRCWSDMSESQLSPSFVYLIVTVVFLVFLGTLVLFLGWYFRHRRKMKLKLAAEKEARKAEVLKQMESKKLHYGMMRFSGSLRRSSRGSFSSVASNESGEDSMVSVLSLLQAGKELPIDDDPVTSSADDKVEHRRRSSSASVRRNSRRKSSLGFDDEPVTTTVTSADDKVEHKRRSSGASVRRNSRGKSSLSIDDDLVTTVTSADDKVEHKRKSSGASVRRNSRRKSSLLLKTVSQVDML